MRALNSQRVIVFELLVLIGMVTQAEAAGGASGGGTEIDPRPPLVSGGYINFESPPLKPIALTHDGRYVLVANTPNNSLVVLSAANDLSFIREIPVGLEPVTVAVQPGAGDRLAWVANHISDNVTIADIRTGRIEAVIEVGDEPVQVLFEPNGAFAFIVIQGLPLVGADLSDPLNPPLGNVVVVNALTYEIVSNTRLDMNTPRAAVYDPGTDRVIVSALHSGNNTTVVGRPAHVGPGLFSSPLEILQDFPPTSAIFARTSGLGTYPDVHVDPDMPATLPFLTRIVHDAGHATGISEIVAVLSDGNGSLDATMVDQLEAFWDTDSGYDVIQHFLDDTVNTDDHDLVVLDASHPEEPGGLPVIGITGGIGSTLSGMALAPDGRLFVTNLEPGNVTRTIESLNGHLVDHRITVVADPLNPSIIRPIDLHAGIDGFNDVSGVNVAAQEGSLAHPTDVAIGRSGTVAFVAALGSSHVGAIDTATGHVLSVVDVPRGPRGLALAPPGRRLYVSSRTDLSVTELDVSDPGHMFVVQTKPMFNPEPRDVRAGRDFLYSTRFSNNFGSSCAICYVDAETDHLAWDLGSTTGPTQPSLPNVPFGIANHPLKGPMVTNTLRGLAGHNPYHWRGDKPSFVDFNAAFVEFMGAQEGLTTAEMAAFDAFIMSIAFPPNPFRERNNAFRDETHALPDIYSCAGCHNRNHDGARPAVDAEGDTGENPHIQSGPVFFVNTQLRGIYKKFQSDRFNGFGLLHDGAQKRFQSQHPLMSFMETFSPLTTREENIKHVAILNAFDANVMPVVGWQVRLAGDDDPAAVAQVEAALDLMVSRYLKSPPHCDVIAYSWIGGSTGSHLLIEAFPVIVFESEDASTITLDDLMASLAPTDYLVFTAVPPGSGFRMALDADSDCRVNAIDPQPRHDNRHDANHDGVVDLQDFFLAVPCVGHPATLVCAVFDADCNGLLDETDFAALIGAMSQPLEDCNSTGITDLLEILTRSVRDEDGNAVPDDCKTPRRARLG